MTTVEILGGVGRGNSYFDPNAFAPVTDVRFGTSGRNIAPRPRPRQSRRQPVPGFHSSAAGLTMQFRAEVFNVTNTPAFNNPGANASAPTRDRRWHDRQLERLYRDHVGPADGTAGPVRPQGQVSKGQHPQPSHRSFTLGIAKVAVTARVCPWVFTRAPVSQK